MGFGRAQHGSKMGRTSAQNRSLEALGRVLGGPWAALGGPWGAKADLRAILGALGLGGSKILENALESHLKFVVNSEVSFGPSGGRGGGVLGSI